jgi:hypothetical protein
MILRRIGEAIAALAFLASTATAADLAYRSGELTVAPVEVGPCSDRKVLANIMERFAWAERHTWHRGYEMASLENPRFRYNVTEPTLIPKTRCEADAMMTDGSARTVYYEIEKGMGFASIGRGINFCVLGLDPWHIYNEACRVVR